MVNTDVCNRGASLSYELRYCQSIRLLLSALVHCRYCNFNLYRLRGIQAIKRVIHIRHFTLQAIQLQYLHPPADGQISSRIITQNDE